MQIINRKRWLLAIAMVIFITAFIVQACATFYHGIYMKGSILETYDSEIYLCIGSKDGATVGQELDVYKIEKIYQPKVQPKAPPLFKRENTGKVKITEIIDEHFAKAKVISGTAEKNSIVELLRP